MQNTGHISILYIAIYCYSSVHILYTTTRYLCCYALLQHTALHLCKLLYIATHCYMYPFQYVCFYYYLIIIVIYVCLCVSYFTQFLVICYCILLLIVFFFRITIVYELLFYRFCCYFVLLFVVCLFTSILFNVLSCCILL